MAEVVWSRRALRDLDRIETYVAADNPLAAQLLGLRLFSAGQDLHDNPHRGRFLRHGLRELVHVRPYLVRYRVVGDRVEIMEVRHGARLPD